MFPRQPQPLPDELGKHYGDMWRRLDNAWVEREFPKIAKFFNDKFHGGKYLQKDRWQHRHYDLAMTQDSVWGAGTTRVYIICAVRPYWFYTVEIARPSNTMMAAVLRGMLGDEWK